MDFRYFSYLASAGTFGLAKPLCNVFHITYRDLFFLILGMVNENNTLFTYHVGQTYDNFLDLGFTTAFLDETNSLFSSNTLEKKARDICGENEECLFDIAVTGKTSVGESTLESYNELQQRTNYSKIGGRSII